MRPAIYHEHFQYAVASAIRALAGNGLALVDIELPPHGGSTPSGYGARPVGQ